LLGQLNYQLLESIVKLAEQTHPGKKLYFFFDEIQHVEGWEKWLHTQLERPKNRYFTVTGSNSFLLAGEYASALTGRHLTFELYPFSFLEYKKVFPQGELADYLWQGGFPRALRFSDPKKLLQEYFNDIILRDVQKRVHARSTESIQQVAKIAFDACGSELSYRKVAAVCGLTTETTKLYLEACEQAYLIFTCEYFAFSIKKRLARNKKFYPIDSGMRAAINTSATKDLGKGLEQLVFLRLKQLYRKVYYWREKGEVDFVTFENKKITPYQVSWEGEQPRHQKALEEFYTAFPQAEEAIFIHKENFATALFLRD
jgi:predicted AAA+ superfamily ATPase